MIILYILSLLFFEMIWIYCKHSISFRVTTLNTQRFYPSFGNILLQDNDECINHFNSGSPSIPHTNCFHWDKFQNANINVVTGLGGNI